MFNAAMMAMRSLPTIWHGLRGGLADLQLERAGRGGSEAPSSGYALADHVSDLAAVGENGKHLRIGLRMNGRPLPGGIAFGRGGQLDSLRRPLLYDVVFKLSVNRWNGTESPELRIEGVFETPEGYAGLRARLAEEWARGPDAWSEEGRRIFGELGLDAGGRWRSLFESPTFLAAVRDEPMPLAA